MTKLAKHSLLKNALATSLRVVPMALLLSCGMASAANFGTDLNLTMMPAAGGMGGVGIASPQGVGASVFGNPATLSQFKGTHFMLGGTFYKPDVKAKHNGLGLNWSGDSKAGPYLLPNVAVSHELPNNLTMGVGVSAISGVGSDFRGIEGSLDPLAEIIVFGANAGLAYQINEQFSLGLMTTIGFGLGQAGLVENTASTSGFGLRGTLGATYKQNQTIIGGYIRTPLAIKYDKMVKYDAGAYHNPTFEQPGEIALGISNSSLMDGNLLLEMDVTYKDWNSAESYQDLYDSQTVFNIGAQLTTGAFKWRAGFIHADSPIKKNVGSNVGTIDSLYISALGGNTALNPGLVHYVQAVNTEVIWEDQVTFGLGWDISKNMTLDFHAAVALQRDEQIGTTKVTAGAWQTAAGLSWKF